MQGNRARLAARSLTALLKFFDDRLLMCSIPPLAQVHEAIMRAPSNEVDDGTVLQEFRRGFKIGGQLLRPAMVQVPRGQHLCQMLSLSQADWEYPSCIASDLSSFQIRVHIYVHVHILYPGGREAPHRRTIALLHVIMSLPVPNFWRELKLQICFTVLLSLRRCRTARMAQQQRQTA